MARQIHFSAEDRLNADAGVIYDVIADYHTGHSLIIPKPPFQGLHVESGGVGAGTVLRVTMRMLGTTTHLHQQVSEPEPGRVLVETNLDGNLQTTFTVVPTSASGSQAQVSISTVMYARPGIGGQIERWLIPWLMRPVYRKELKLLEEVARRKMATMSGLNAST
jgi:hypothetical protein